MAVVNSVRCSIVCGGLLAHAAWIFGDSRQPGMGDAQMVGWPPQGDSASGHVFGAGTGCVLKVDMVRMFWLLLGVYGFVTTLHGQWQELDAALTEQVNSGWLSGQERLCILDVDEMKWSERLE